MDRNKFVAVIDPSSLIWDKTDYDSNKHNYESIIEYLPKLISGIQNYPILISEKQLEIMINDFPLHDATGDFWAFTNKIYAFLINIGGKTIEYVTSIINKIDSIPEQIKVYFSTPLKEETSKLLRYCHENLCENRIYFSFTYLWNASKQLKTIQDTNCNNHIAVIVDRDNELEDFLSLLQLKFEHKIKHDISVYRNKEAWLSSDEHGRKDFESQLSCILNKTEQSLLDKRYDVSFGNDRFYSYDYDNEVYVVFRKTDGNIFHAHDEYNINNVPEEIKKHYRIYKYSWI